MRTKTTAIAVSNRRRRWRPRLRRSSRRDPRRDSESSPCSSCSGCSSCSSSPKRSVWGSRDSYESRPSTLTCCHSSSVWPAHATCCAAASACCAGIEPVLQQDDGGLLINDCTSCFPPHTARGERTLRAHSSETLVDQFDG